MFGNKRTSRPKALQVQLCAAGAGVGRGRHSQGLPGTHRPGNLHCWVQRARTEVDWLFLGGFRSFGRWISPLFICWLLCPPVNIWRAQPLLFFALASPYLPIPAAGAAREPWANKYL